MTAPLRPSYRYLAACLVVVSAVRLGLTVLGYARLRRLLDAYEPRRTVGSADIRKVALGVPSAARFVPGASCLTQALAGRLLLTAMGRPSIIRIGIDRASPKKLSAHAWLLSDDKVVLGGNAASMRGFAHMVDLGRER